MRNEHGGVIVGYFTKIALVLTVFAVVCFDAVSVGVARVGVEDIARSAAVEAAEAWNNTRDRSYAFKAASDYAESHGATIVRKSFRIDEEGVVSLTVEKEATTLLLYRTKKTAPWAQVSATGTGRAV
jgi:hypothetical protein